MKIVIIGNGIAGITAARYIRMMSDHDITVISGETKHFYSRCALMYIYMGQMRYEDTKPYEDHFWAKNKIGLMQDLVEKIYPEEKYITTATGVEIKYDKLLLCTGSKWNKLDIPGIELQGVQGLYSLQDLEQMANNTRGIKKAVVAGGGLIGVEMCEMLRSKGIEVTFLVREKKFFEQVFPPEESEMLTAHFKQHKVKVLLETELAKINADAQGRVRSVTTNKGEEIPCEFTGITIGVHPDISLAKNNGIPCDKGILVNKYMETQVADIFTAGDCAQHQDNEKAFAQVEQFWYSAKMQGKAAAFNICGMHKPYDPGIYFNSAKFFDIEHQVYGNAPAVIEPPLEYIFWQNKEKTQSIRIIYDGENGKIKGFSLLGVRYRHEICNKMIAEEWPIEEVMSNLAAVNFDPEFKRKHEPEMVEIYNKRCHKQIKLKPKKKLWNLIFQRA